MLRFLMAGLVMAAAMGIPSPASPEQEIAHLARVYGIDECWVLAVATVETLDGRLVCWNADGSADVGRLQVNSTAIRALRFAHTTQGQVDFSAITIPDMIARPALTLEAGVIMLRWWLRESLAAQGVYRSLDREWWSLRHTGEVYNGLAEEDQRQAIMRASAWYNGGPGSDHQTWYVYRVLAEYRAWREGERRRLPPLREAPVLRRAVLRARRRWAALHIPEYP